MAAFLTVHRLSKRFGEVPVLAGVSLDVEEGEVVVLLGPSGSGKTTLLRLVAGFETPDAGDIRVEGEEVTRLPPAKRNFGMVFQHYALFPHLTVAENVAFGLEARRVKRTEIAERVAEVLPLVDLAGFGERRAHQLSGGQQQRVALARALAPRPRLLLLDEPLSNLDPTLRERTRRQLRSTLGRVGITALWVTHEQAEAFDVGDRVALLEGGRLQQTGPPEELYLEPANPFVAGFVGRASTLEGFYVPATPGDGEVRIGDDRYLGHGVRWPALPAVPLQPDEPVLCVLRPEALELREVTDDTLAGEVAERRYAGETTLYRVRLVAGGELLVAGGPETARAGDKVGVGRRAAGPPPRLFPRPAEAK